MIMSVQVVGSNFGMKKLPKGVNFIKRHDGGGGCGPWKFG